VAVVLDKNSRGYDCVVLDHNPVSARDMGAAADQTSISNRDGWSRATFRRPGVQPDIFMDDHIAPE
jgi:hypothetical protein